MCSFLASIIEEKIQKLQIKNSLRKMAKHHTNKNGNSFLKLSSEVLLRDGGLEISIVALSLNNKLLKI